MSNLVPGTLVLRFFLTPDDVARVWIAADNLRELFYRKGVDLLDTYDGHIGHFVHLTRLDEIVVDLAAAKYDATRFLRVDTTSVGNN